jgi:hypothetical protein
MDPFMVFMLVWLINDNQAQNIGNFKVPIQQNPYYQQQLELEKQYYEQQLLKNLNKENIYFPYNIQRTVYNVSGNMYCEQKNACFAHRLLYWFEPFARFGEKSMRVYATIKLLGSFLAISNSIN